MTGLNIISRARVLLASLLFSAVCAANSAQTCPDNGASRADAPPAASDAVTIKAVGDLVFGSDWPTSSYPPGFEKDVATGLKQLLGPADIIFGNFEGTLTTSEVSTKTPNASTVFAFRMPPVFAQLLHNAGFSVINIANNHTFDFGQPGFSDTIANLSKAGILAIGESNNISLQKTNGVSIAWIGFSHLYRHNYVGDLARLTELVQRARPLADLVIVSMQAGAENSEALKVRDYDEIFLGENRGNTYAFAHRAIDLGADLVIGHGPHVVRGMECYRGKLIAYSLGNFVGYGALSIKRAAAVSMILDVKLAKNRRTVSFDVTPVKFNSLKLPEPDDSALVRYLLNDLSRLAPLNGSVTLPVSEEGRARYRQWLTVSDLIDILNK